jgi:MtN3 and saliva related transmembrane protein
MSIAEPIGWLSSAVLLATIGSQIFKQWHDDTSRGVSKWLFLGQIAASIGFSIYSALVGNVVFVFTNIAMLVSALAGYGIVLHHRRRAQ